MTGWIFVEFSTMKAKREVYMGFLDRLLGRRSEERPIRQSAEAILEKNPDGTFTARLASFPELSATANTEADTLEELRRRAEEFAERGAQPAHGLRLIADEPRRQSASPGNADGQPAAAINAGARRRRNSNELLGMLRRIVADGIVTPAEVHGLIDWMAKNPELICDLWPGDEIRACVLEARDRGLNRATCEALKELFLTVVAHGSVPEPDAPSAHEPAARANVPTEFAYTHPPPEIFFAGRRFVLTGKFNYGSRRQCEQAVEARGGICTEAVGVKTDVVVIGSHSSRDWAQTAFGRKIEQAAANVKAGRPTVIVSEEHWVRFL
jgi:NAD-dependent DNA ligase